MKKKKKERKDTNKQNQKEKGDITMGITEIQKLIRDYYEQLYTKKLEIPEEMGKFLVTFNLPRRNLKEIESLNIPK